MPRRDGTGPAGLGPMTGRCLGLCNNRASRNFRGLGLGLGLGCKRGFGWYGANFIDDVNQKDLLKMQKDILENRLQIIKQQLDKYEDDK